jgi:pyrroloquinoline quinone biosynthesis protein B
MKWVLGRFFSGLFLLIYSYSSSLLMAQEVELLILGTVQDAGAPQIGCTKSCCSQLQNNPDTTLKVVSLGLTDYSTQKKYLFEATPDFSSQVYLLNRQSNFTSSTFLPDGIFLTHAHIGHYTGLMFLGKEAMSANKTPVFVMPKMKGFLETNGPWSQLVSNQNIALHSLSNLKEIALSNHLKVIPFIVPHRDEYSETVGYKIVGPNKSALFIPDIDKWEKWDTAIEGLIKEVDYAFIDATFFDAEEINNRDISQIPHPFIVESMALFNSLSKAEKAKIYFIHMNHTNPALNPTSSATKEIIDAGFNIARFMNSFRL